MAGEMPPQVQNQIRQYQEVQQKLQNVMSQKQQMDMQLKELDRTLSALEDADDDTPLYRSVGSILVGVDDADALEDELSEQKETIEVRLKSIEKQESGLRDRLETLQGTLENLLGQGPQGPA